MNSIYLLSNYLMSHRGRRGADSEESAMPAHLFLLVRFPTKSGRVFRRSSAQFALKITFEEKDPFPDTCL